MKREISQEPGREVESEMAQWWDERELRILVLASISAQYSLALFAALRKFHIPPWLRFSFRLAHVGSDALAIFALATLVSRQKEGPGCSYARGSRELELLWAPILVMHLGGQVVITTYKIEDNEQWSRHILTSLSKVTVALYVFYKTWSSNDKRLLAATILLFNLVIIRCFQKSLDLKRSSFNALREANPSTVSVMDRINLHVRENEHLDEFINGARGIVQRCPEPGTTVGLPSLPCQPFLDILCSYSDRLTILRNFWSLDGVSAYRAIEGALSAITSFLYTKDDITPQVKEKKDDSAPYLAFENAPAQLIFRWCTQVLAHATVITAICLVHTSRHKEDGSSREDAEVTLVLLYGTLLLELVYWSVQSAFQDKFSGRILQHNLIGLFAHNIRHPRLTSIVRWLQCKDLIVDFWHIMEPSYSCKEITELVRQHVQSGWKHYIEDSESYGRFNDSRGEWTLSRNECGDRLLWSIQRPFDESIMLWHLATYLCFHRSTGRSTERACRCNEMSNYMMHLLYDNPDMLLPGSRKSLFKTAYQELEVIIQDHKVPQGEDEFAELVFARLLACCPISTDYTLIGDALVLATILLDIDGGTMWELIQGVWVEMLCFSAGRCRGYLHLETLGTGVEYLSYVWVLLVYTGMETFPEKLQRRQGQSFC